MTDDCGKGYTTDSEDNNKCKQCHAGCSECSGLTENDCTACPAGKVVRYDRDDTNGGHKSTGKCFGML